VALALTVYLGLIDVGVGVILMSTRMRLVVLGASPNCRSSLPRHPLAVFGYILHHVFAQALGDLIGG
jgi:hypothetical protein